MAASNPLSHTPIHDFGGDTPNVLSKTLRSASPATFPSSGQNRPFASSPVDRSLGDSLSDDTNDPASFWAPYIPMEAATITPVVGNRARAKLAAVSQSQQADGEIGDKGGDTSAKGRQPQTNHSSSPDTSIDEQRETATAQSQPYVSKPPNRPPNNEVCFRSTMKGSTLDGKISRIVYPIATPLTSTSIRGPAVSVAVADDTTATTTTTTSETNTIQPSLVTTRLTTPMNRPRDIMGASVGTGRGTGRPHSGSGYQAALESFSNTHVRSPDLSSNPSGTFPPTNVSGSTKNTHHPLAALNLDGSGKDSGSNAVSSPLSQQLEPSSMNLPHPPLDNTVRPQLNATSRSNNSAAIDERSPVTVSTTNDSSLSNTLDGEKGGQRQEQVEDPTPPRPSLMDRLGTVIETVGSVAGMLGGVMEGVTTGVWENLAPALSHASYVNSVSTGCFLLTTLALLWIHSTSLVMQAETQSLLQVSHAYHMEEVTEYAEEGVEIARRLAAWGHFCEAALNKSTAFKFQGSSATCREIVSLQRREQLRHASTLVNVLKYPLGDDSPSPAAAVTQSSILAKIANARRERQFDSSSLTKKELSQLSGYLSNPLSKTLSDINVAMASIVAVGRGVSPELFNNVSLQYDFTNGASVERWLQAMWGPKEETSQTTIAPVDVVFNALPECLFLDRLFDEFLQPCLSNHTPLSASGSAASLFGRLFGENGVGDEGGHSKLQPLLSAPIGLPGSTTADPSPSKLCLGSLAGAVGLKEYTGCLSAVEFFLRESAFEKRIKVTIAVEGVLTSGRRTDAVTLSRNKRHHQRTKQLSEQQKQPITDLSTDTTSAPVFAEEKDRYAKGLIMLFDSAAAELSSLGNATRLVQQYVQMVTTPKATQRPRRRPPSPAPSSTLPATPPSSESVSTYPSGDTPPTHVLFILPEQYNWSGPLSLLCSLFVIWYLYRS